MWGKCKKFPHFKPSQDDCQRTDTENNRHCPRKGWSVNVEDKNETRVLFEFQRYTKYGQDFLFNADMQGEDIDTLIASVKEYYEGLTPIMKPICG